MNDILKKSYPYLLTVLLFFVLASVYFPQTYQGKEVSMHDKKTWQGMAKEVKDFEKETGETSLWTNSMFGGMPTFLINTYVPHNYVKYINKLMQLNFKLRPISFALLYFLGFYIALLAFKFDKWQAIIGALAFGLSSYFFIIIQAGHITKATTIGFMPPIIAGIYLAYNGKRVLGTAIMSLFLALQLLNNHLQITYYTMLIIIIMVIVLFINDVKEKRINEFLKSTAFLAIGLFLVIGANFESLYTTYDYGKVTTRGKSELTNDKENKTSGLDRDYATDWSYGKMETFNLLIPNLFGGASGGELSEKSASYEALTQIVKPNQAKDIIKRYPLYWGPQPMTSGPVYIGAIVIFLFIMGIFLVKGPIRTWLIAATILSITLAWGRNFMWLTDFFFDYIPGYNKFRTVSMILVIAEFTMPLLGMFALRDIIAKKVSKEQVINALKYSLGITIGIIVAFFINPNLTVYSGHIESDSVFNVLILFVILIIVLIFKPYIKYLLKNNKIEKKSYDTFSKVIIGVVIIIGLIITKYLLTINNGLTPFFTGTEADYFMRMFGINDPNQGRQITDLLVPALLEDRASIFRSDAIRSLIIILIGATAIWLYIKEKLKLKYLYFVLVVVVVFDLWNVDKRYLNESHFVSKRKADVPYQPTAADNIILEDTSDYRVLNLSVSTFNDASTSYFHKSIGGYHGAKMKRYQELISYGINTEISEFYDIINTNQSQYAIEDALSNLSILNMLNTKYFIMPTKNGVQPIRNPYANTSAWFVDNYKIVKNADEEIAALKDFKSKNTAIVDERFKDNLFDIKNSNSSSIELTEYKPNKLIYKSKAETDQLAVFSEIYYEKGWNAYIDGEIMPHFRANYVLRAMRVPKGEHEIIFKFEPESVFFASISSISSILLILIVFGTFFLEITNNKLVRKFD